MYGTVPMGLVTYVNLYFHSDICTYQTDEGEEGKQLFLFSSQIFILPGFSCLRYPSSLPLISSTCAEDGLSSGAVFQLWFNLFRGGHYN